MLSFHNWRRQRRVQHLSLEGLATASVPGIFTLKSGVWNYAAWATGSVFGQTPLAEMRDPEKITFCLAERLRTDIGGNTRHDGYLLLTLFRDTEEPFDPLGFNRRVLPNEDYWAAGYRSVAASGEVHLYQPEGSWPVWIAHHPRKKMAAFFLSEKRPAEESRQLLLSIMDSVQVNDETLARYFETAGPRPLPDRETVDDTLARPPVRKAAESPKRPTDIVYVPTFDRTARPPFFPIENQGGWKGYIDRTGHLVHDTTLAEAQHFSEGLAWIRRGDYWYAIGEDGRYHLHLKFNDVHEAWPFSCGWARFTRGTSVWHWGGPRGDEDFYEFEGKYYLIREDGLVIEQAFEWAGDFVDGLVNVHDGQQSRCLNTDGLPSSPPPRGSTLPLGWQPFLFSGAKPLYGYKDESGVVRIEPAFELAQPFREEVAAVSQNGRWGYIDRRGEWVIYPRFTEASPFRDGLARVRSGKALAYTDRAGKYVWKQSLS